MPDTGLLQPRSRRSLLTLAACSAVVQIVAVLAGLWVVLHYIQMHITKQPLLMLLFPPLAVSDAVSNCNLHLCWLRNLLGCARD
jgi:hypothetical protein